MLTATRPSEAFQSSELSRNAREVFAAAEDHPVDVTRRDGEDLVLMSRREADSRSKLLQLAGTLIAVATDNEGSLAERMANHLPWMLALKPKDQEQCARELLSAARASFATGQAHLAVAELTAWYETATALAAGLTLSDIEPFDQPIAAEPMDAETAV